MGLAGTDKRQEDYELAPGSAGRMRVRELLMMAALCCATTAIVSGQTPYDTSDAVIAQVGCCDCNEAACGCELALPDCGCESPCGGSCGAEPLCGWENQCDSGRGSCRSGGIFDGCSCLGKCDLGDPYALLGECCGWSAGGWLQLGYTSAQLPAFNTYDDVLQAQQAWLFVEKAMDTSCGFGIGGRIDYLYGTDGPNTQAFGTDPRGWDNRWDNGGQYGQAIPQAYLEAGYGDLSVKAGHFYTIIGYEVVQATGNFFYSHAYTFNFSEPFTHTGVLATYKASEDVTVWGGFSFGWDSGFDDNGDAFLGGISLGLTDDLTLTYATIGGRFVEPWSGITPLAISGYQHSVVADFALCDSLNYVFQSDLLSTDFADGTNARDTIGINQYLIKTINDCWGVGARFEWWNVEDGRGPDQDVFALTTGVNYRPHANVIVRPEIRWDWDDDGTGLLEDGDDSQTTFGIDTILTF